MSAVESKTSPLNASAFTLIEIVVVVIIAGVLAMAAVTQYFKTVEKTKMNTAMMNARAIYSAVQVYCGRLGTCPNADWDMDTINNTLELNIIDPEFTYTLGGNAGNPPLYTIFASRQGRYTVRCQTAAPLTAANPDCMAGTQSCPGP